LNARSQPAVRHFDLRILIAVFATMAATLTVPPRNLWAQSLLIQAGVAHTPEEWMQQP
jgi:hypothetical protein